jgi:hypothetical protein
MSGKEQIALRCAADPLSHTCISAYATPILGGARLSGNAVLRYSRYARFTAHRIT